MKLNNLATTGSNSNIIFRTFTTILPDVSAMGANRQGGHGPVGRRAGQREGGLIRRPQDGPVSGRHEQGATLGAAPYRK